MGRLPWVNRFSGWARHEFFGAAYSEALAQLEAVVIIAMHYETPDLGWGLDTIDKFLVGKTVVDVAARSLVINADALPADPTVFVLPYE